MPSRILRPLLLLALAILPATALAQGLDQVQIRTTEIAPGIYTLEGAGGTMAMSVGDDGVILIDDQFAPLTDKIRYAIAQVTNRPVRFVLNTHWHGDHTGGNENFAKGGAWVMAHDNVRVRMSAEQYRQLFDRRDPPSPEGAWPVVTFSENVSFHLNGHDIDVFHAPNAHTDGDAIVHFKNRNVIHMGDVMFSGMYPFVDTSTGGNVRGVLRAVERVLPLADGGTKIVCGHGPVTNREGLRAYRDMLRTAISRVETLVAEGRTLEEVVAAKPMADHDARYASDFMTPARFLTVVYWSLKR